MAFNPVHYTILIFLVIVVTYHQAAAWRPGSELEAVGTESLFCFKFRVHVINGFSNNNKPLQLHCWSRDDELGNHTMYNGADFNFKFGAFGKTIFTCTFEWGGKHQEFAVFTNGVESATCCKTSSCYWRTQDDGIYFSIDNQDYSKKYDWL